MAIDHVTDHQERAVARMTEHLRAGDTTQKFVRALTAEFQVIEEVFQDLLTDTTIDAAVGAQLDMLGRIIGQPREGREDEVYRLWIRTRVRLNRSSGTPEDIISVFAALTQGQASIVLEEQFPAAFVIRVGFNSIVPPAELAELARFAKAAGVYVVVESATSDDPTSFAFDPNGAGFGDATNPEIGGGFAAAF